MKHKMLAKFSDFNEPQEDELISLRMAHSVKENLKEGDVGIIDLFGKYYEYRGLQFRIKISDKYLMKNAHQEHVEWIVTSRNEPSQVVYKDFYGLYEGDIFLKMSIHTEDLPTAFYDIIQRVQNQIDYVLDILIGKAVSEIEKSRAPPVSEPISVFDI